MTTATLSTAAPERVEHCQRHGEFTSRMWRQPYGRRTEERWTSCPACATEESERQRAAEHEAAELDRKLDWLQRSGLKGRYLETTLESFQATAAKPAKVLAACRTYADGIAREWRPLWLIGAPGTGKSHLGSAIALRCIEQGTSRPCVLTARELIRALRATWRRDATETEEACIERFGKAPLLVLDEVGVGFGSEAENTQLYDVLDLRYQLRLPLVAISNLNTSELRTLLGERLFDRLRENAKVLTCDWPSFRGR